jgi:hypothetical protein
LASHFPLNRLMPDLTGAELSIGINLNGHLPDYSGG